MSAAPSPPDLSRLRIATEERAPSPGRRMGRVVAVVVGVALAAALGWVARGFFVASPGGVASSSSASSASSASSVPAAPAASAASRGVTSAASPAPGTVLAGGRVESSGRRELAFAQAGVVGVVHVARGQAVKAGDVLIELDAAVERADAAEARAALAAARARLEELRDGARPEEREEAQRNVDAAVALAGDAADKAAQAAALAARGAVSRAAEQEAAHAAAAARARADSAKARLALLTRGARNTSLAAAQAEVARGEAALAQAAARLSAATLVAPADGTVVEVRVRPGEVTGAAAQTPPALVLTDLRHLVVKVDVPEAKATRVRPGDPARVTVEALAAAPFAGHVRDVSVEADWQKGTLEVTVAFDDGADQETLARVRPRMAARVAIDVKE